MLSTAFRRRGYETESKRKLYYGLKDVCVCMYVFVYSVCKLIRLTLCIKLKKVKFK